MVPRLSQYLLLSVLALAAAMSAGAAPAPNKKTPPAKTPPAVDAGSAGKQTENKDDPANWPQFRVAVMAFAGVNVKPELLTFYTEHFGAALAANGVKVTTPSQIAAVIGFERQKQLLGCDEGESCIMELGNALGVDGIVTATLANLDNTYRLNIKIVSAANGELLSGSGEAANKALRGQNAVADELTLAAKHMSAKAAGRARRNLIKAGAVIVPPTLPKLPAEAPVEKKPPEEAVVENKTPPADAPVETKDQVVAEAPKQPPAEVEKKQEPPAKPPSNTGAKFLMVTGGVIGGVGLISLGVGVAGALRLRSGDTSIPNYSQALSLSGTSALFEFLGWSGLAVGIPLFLIGMSTRDTGPKVSARLLWGNDSGALVFEGTLP